MGVRPQHSSRTARDAYREFNRTGRLRPAPEYLAGQKALRLRENQEVKRQPLKKEN